MLTYKAIYEFTKGQVQVFVRHLLGSSVAFVVLRELHHVACTGRRNARLAAGRDQALRFRGAPKACGRTGAQWPLHRPSTEGVSFESSNPAVVAIEEGEVAPQGQRRGDDHRQGRRAFGNGHGHRGWPRKTVPLELSQPCRKRTGQVGLQFRRLPRGAGRQERLQTLVARLRPTGRLPYDHTPGSWPAGSCPAIRAAA